MSRLKSLAELVRSFPVSFAKFVFCNKSLKIVKELGGLVLATMPKLVDWARFNAPYIAGGCAYVASNKDVIYVVLALISLYLALRD